MKNFLPLIVLATAILVGFPIQEFPWLPPRVSYVPDLVIGAVSAILIARLIATRRMSTVPLKYVLVFVGYCYVVISGTVINHVSPEVTFAGIRMYFKYVPLFLLPFAYDYSPIDVRKQALAVLGLALLQLPLALRQRFILHASASTDRFTGDVVTGTMGPGGANTLSIFLVSVIIVVFALYFSRRLSLRSTLVLVVLLAVPTMINESKSTPIFFLVGAAGVVFVKRRSINVKQILFAASAAILMGAMFIATYNQLFSSSWKGAGYLEVMTSEKMMTAYNASGVRAEELKKYSIPKEIVAEPWLLSERKQHFGRYDSLLMPFQAFLPDDPVRLMFGVGIGNVISTFGAGGEYKFVDARLGGTYLAVTQLMWESGLLGAFFYLLFMVFVLRDSMALSAEPQWGPYAAGWTGVCAIILLVCFFQSLFIGSVLLSFYVYFSGLVASKRQAVRVATAREAAPGLDSLMPR